MDPDVLKLIETTNHLNFINESEKTKVKCFITGHEMIPKVDIIETYLSSKKLKKNLEWYQYDFSKYEPHIVSHKTKEKNLYCRLTQTVLNKIPSQIEKHCNGKKFIRLRKEYDAYLARKKQISQKDIDDDDESIENDTEEYDRDDDNGAIDEFDINQFDYIQQDNNEIGDEDDEDDARFAHIVQKDASIPKDMREKITSSANKHKKKINKNEIKERKEEITDDLEDLKGNPEDYFISKSELDDELQIPNKAQSKKSLSTSNITSKSKSKPNSSHQHRRRSNSGELSPSDICSKKLTDDDDDNGQNNTINNTGKKRGRAEAKLKKPKQTTEMEKKKPTKARTSRSKA